MFVCRSQIIVIYLLSNATTIIFTLSGCAAIQYHSIFSMYTVQVLVCGIMVVFKDQIRGEESNKITDRESPCD